MAPFDGSNQHKCNCKNKSCGDSKTPSLKLAFSTAADYDRINKVFDPAIKHQYDPTGYVFKREESAFTRAVQGGHAAFLQDQHGTVETLTIAYHVAAQGKSAATPDYTELGTTLARLPGYHSARLIVAALALHEWWQSPPVNSLAAEIKHANIPSLKTYRDALGWEAITDRTETQNISAITDQTLANPDDQNNDVDAWMAMAAWYRPTNASLALQARLVLSFMDQGGLLNKKTGDFIPVDFSDLTRIGLTRKRLEALAGGETDRAKIRQVAAP